MNWKAWLLRFWRAGVLIALIAAARPRPAPSDAGVAPPRVTIEQARRFFPDAEDLRDPDRERRGQYVLNQGKNPIGYVLTTSPETDDIVGYTGPNNLLVALDANGAVVGFEILSSGDTREHAALVRRDEKFAGSFRGWTPATQPPPPVDAVSGATLTSAAMAEGIQRRLAGTALSLRFPERVLVRDARGIFPDAKKLEADGKQLKVLDAEGNPLGFVVRTSPYSDNIAGYAGPSESIVGLKPDGKTVAGIWIRKSFDTQSYIDRIHEDRYWMKQVFTGRSTDDLGRMDFEREKIEGVSGATKTSWAMAEGIRLRFAAELAQRAAAEKALTKTWRPRPRDWGLAAVVVGSLLMTFTHLRGQVWMRRVWQVVLIAYIGFWNGDFLSLSLLAGWTQHGVAWKALPSLALLLAVALVVPWGTRRQFYCHHFCPHGVAQQWLGGLIRKKPKLPRRFVAVLEWIPALLLSVALVAMLRGWSLNLASLEAFDAWVWRAAGVATIAIAVVGLIASLFVPQAYCRFGCPTGALLEFVRSHGRADHFARRDWLALALVIGSLLLR